MRRKDILFLLLLAVSSVTAGCTSWSETFEDREMLKQHVQNAQRYYHVRQYERAVHQTKKALDIDPKHSKALVLLGYCYLQVTRLAKDREARLEYFEKSEKAFEDSILAGSETDPAIFKAYFGLGLVYFMWSQEVKDMILESKGEVTPANLAGSGRGPEEDLWSK